MSSLFTPETETYIEHEVKIRTLQNQTTEIYKKFDRIDTRIDWVIGLVITSIVLPTILHYLKLV